MSGETPVHPIVASGRVPEVPVCQLNEDSACRKWVRGPAVGVLRAELSWISWFNNWVGAEI